MNVLQMALRFISIPVTPGHKIEAEKTRTKPAKTETKAVKRETKPAAGETKPAKKKTKRLKTETKAGVCERCQGTANDGCVFDYDYIVRDRYVCTSCSDEILAESDEAMAERRSEIPDNQAEAQ